MKANQSKGEKTSLHPRNRNRNPYDFEQLTKSTPALTEHIHSNKWGIESIDFSNLVAVRLLNQAILHHYYGITFWEFSEANLCPPIPGRAEYIHYVADLLKESNGGKIPTGPEVVVLDIGVGASCIYPIIGVTEYSWKFLGTDIDPKSIQQAEQIIRRNGVLNGQVHCKIQPDANRIFQGILTPKDKIDAVICNPPFHATKEALLKGNKRKVRNLTGKKAAQPKFNFSGNQNELIYKGGAFQFIKNMISESKNWAKSIFWFTILVAQKSNLKKIVQELDKYAPAQKKVIELNAGNKMSRILAWTYLKPSEQEQWAKERKNPLPAQTPSFH